MREEKESITIFEDLYDGFSRYSQDFKHAYSIPDCCGCYRLHDGCMTLELKGGESMCDELILPPSFTAFYADSMLYLPYLRKITAYSEFHFCDENGLIGGFGKYVNNTKLEEICVLPWLVDMYKRRLDTGTIKVTPIPDNLANQFTISSSNGLTTSMDGKNLVKVDRKIKVLEIPVEIERIAATAFDNGNSIEKIVILGNSEDYHKDRNDSIDFDKETINALNKVEAIVFQGPQHTSFYNEIPNLKTVIFPLWNYSHFCFRGSEAECADIHPFEIKTQNFSSVELVEEDGIISNILNIKDFLKKKNEGKLFRLIK